MNKNEPIIIEAVVTRLKSGDSLAFDELYNCFSQDLFRYLQRSVGSKQIAEDLLHDSFMQMIDKIDYYKISKSDHIGFKQWLFRLATNLMIDYHRRNKLEQRYKNQIFSDLENVETTNAESVDDLKLITSIMSELPTKQKALLSLRVDQGLSYQEIAKICSCSIGMVKQTIFSARECVRDNFNKLQKESL